MNASNEKFNMLTRKACVGTRGKAKEFTFCVGRLQNSFSLWFSFLNSSFPSNPSHERNSMSISLLVFILFSEGKLLSMPRGNILSSLLKSEFSTSLSNSIFIYKSLSLRRNCVRAYN